ncbi:TetR/AcrR family transcriptional regulator [Mesobacterium pallidum]|uniref:TetR/AcrR family transcriptional regulator n=1 Tax=Mesobacterium pallidum TaxID=2872037 RepID=UPI001EE39F4A|nr:TetR/AcrR family transcriptional regulator [Mesobacterium pallidum]
MSHLPRKPRGRPRSKAARDRALAVAREIIETEGVARLTVEGVAARAGIGKPTIYRTWANAQELAMAALIAQVPGPDALWSSDILDVLRRQLTGLCEAFSSPLGRQMAQVLAGADPESALGRAFRKRVVMAARDEGRGLILAAVQEGLISAPADTDVLLDMIYGPLFYRLLVGHAPLDDALVGGIVDMLLRAHPPAPKPAKRKR